MATEKPKEADEAPKKKSKKKLIIIAAAALLLAGVGGYLMLGSGGSKKVAAKPPPKEGIVIALDAITMNLSGGHYLKLKMALQGTMTATKALDGSKALDLSITEFTDRDMAELSSEQGRAKAKADLLSKLAKAYPDAIMDIYFTEFVMQ